MLTHQSVLEQLCDGAVRLFPLLPPPVSTQSPGGSLIAKLEQIPEAPRTPREQRIEAAQAIITGDTSSDRFRPLSEAGIKRLDDVYADDIHSIRVRYPGMLIPGSLSNQADPDIRHLSG